MFADLNVHNWRFHDHADRDRFGVRTTKNIVDIRINVADAVSEVFSYHTDIVFHATLQHEIHSKFALLMYTTESIFFPSIISIAVS